MISKKQITWPLLAISVITIVSYVGYQAQQRAERNLIETVVFNECVSKGVDIEMRRVCGRFAKAYADGKKDYIAWDKTLTWDIEARTYVVKETAK